MSEEENTPQEENESQSENESESNESYFPNIDTSTYIERGLDRDDLIEK